jgi:hypothetical protein
MLPDDEVMGGHPFFFCFHINVEVGIQLIHVTGGNVIQCGDMLKEQAVGPAAFVSWMKKEDEYFAWHGAKMGKSANSFRQPFLCGASLF